MSLLRSRVAVLDTETTGFESNRLACVIDVGAIILDTDGTEIASFSTLVKPIAWGDWCAGAEAVHGITREQAESGAAPGAVAADLEEWLAEHDCRWVTAYNVGFDRPMLARMGLRGSQGRPMWGPCVMDRAVSIMGPAGVLRPADPSHPRYRPESPWLFPPLCPKPESGTSACEFFGVDPSLPAHRALSDATTAARVLLAIVNRATRAP